MLDRNRYNVLLTEFEREFKNNAVDAVSWYGIGGDEIVVRLSDGSRVIYNGATKGARCIPAVENVNKRDSYVDEDLWRKRFGQNLKAIMRTRGYSAKHLSDVSDIPYATIHLYANGRTSPSGPNLTRIARALGCSVSELTYFDD